MQNKYCSNCRNGEIKREADYKVKGIVWVSDEKSMPYTAYLCSDHLEMLIQDDAELTIVEWVSEKAIKERCEELVEQYTGYDSFNDMCKNNPTLRGFAGARWLKEQYLISKGA